MKRSVIRLTLLSLFAVVAVADAPTPANVAGTWDLFWVKRSGKLAQSGELVLEQKGSKLDATLRGRGEVKAKGTIEGSTLELKGTRMLTPYVIRATVDGSSMTGSFKVLTVEQKFTARLRK